MIVIIKVVDDVVKHYDVMYINIYMNDGHIIQQQQQHNASYMYVHIVCLFFFPLYNDNRMKKIIFDNICK